MASKAPEVVPVEPIPSTETFESLVWDGSNTVKALNFLGEGWKLVPEETQSDVSGRSWTISKRLEHAHRGYSAFVGDVLIKSSTGVTDSLTPDQFKELYRKASK